MKKVLFNLALLVAALAVARSASASFVEFTGSDPSRNLSSDATFTDLGSGNLQVTLVNTFTGDTVDQAHVLTALRFTGTGALTPVSAGAGAGSLQWLDKTSSSPATSAMASVP